MLKQLYLAIKTRKSAPTMSVFEYFCWRIVRTRNLPNIPFRESPQFPKDWGKVNGKPF